MRVEGQQRKPGGINNETFIKAGGTWRIPRCTGRLLMQPLLFLVPRVRTTLRVPTESKATCSLLALYNTAPPPPVPRNPVCIVLLLSLYL